MSDPARESIEDDRGAHELQSTAQAENSTIASAELHVALESGAEAHNYYAWLSDTFAPYLRGTVIEHGSGRGTLASALLTGGVRPLILSEPNEKLAAVLAKKFETQEGVTVFQGTLEHYLARVGPNAVDAIVSSNVLEHILDDEGCLATMRTLIRPGGNLVIYVPARPELYGPFDRLVGHHRRYRRSELKQKLLAAGFKIERLRYRNMIATLPWLWNRISNKKDISEGNVRFFDRYIFPIIRRAEDLMPPVYGLNLVAIAR